MPRRSTELVKTVLAEQIALGWGGAAIGLQVFNDNTPARRLYELLGYASTARVFLKDLGSAVGEQGRGPGALGSLRLAAREWLGPQATLPPHPTSSRCR